MSFSLFKRPQERPLVWAHRGASGYLPENTMEAYERAIELGADGIELDVHLSKDGQIVVIHDEKLGRVSDGKGWVKDLTLEELRKFNYNKTHKELAFAHIPTLREVYDFMKPTGKTINVELKTGIVFYPGLEDMVVALTKEMGMEDQVLYSSFNHYSCLRLHELNPEAYVGFLYSDGMLDAVDYAAKHGANALHPSLNNIQYPGYLEQAAAAGIDINPWPINQTDWMEMCCKAHVNAMITDYPDRALRVAEAMRQSGGVQ